MKTRIAIFGMRWAAALALVVVAPAVGAATCTWLGAGADPNWSTAANWNCGGGAQPVPAQGDVILFPPTLAQPNSNNDIPGLTLAQIQFTGPNYVVTGQAISLTGGIVAAVPIGGASDTGPIFGPAITLAASGQSVQCIGARSITFGGPLHLSNFNLAIDATCAISVLGTTSGAGGITKQGAGTLTLDGSNSYGGTTTVDAGTLRIASNTALGATGAGTVVNSGAALELEVDTNSSEPLTLNGVVGGGGGTLRSISGSAVWAGPVVLGTSATIDTTSASSLTIVGTISDFASGSTGLTKIGGGKLILNAANTYTGTTSVDVGVLLGNGDGSFGAGGVGNGTVVSDGAQLQIEGGITVADEPLTLNGTGINSTGALMSLGGTNTWAGKSAVPTGTVTFFVDGVMKFTGEASGGGGVRKIGPGTMEYSGANTYGGVTEVQQGTLVVASNTALGTGGSVGAGTTVSNGATLQLQGNLSIDESLVLNGSGVAGAGALMTIGDITSTGPVMVPTGQVIFQIDGNTARFPGTTSGGGGITKIGAGTLELSGDNTYGGVTEIQQGALIVASNTALGANGAGSGTIVRSGAALELTGGIDVDEPLSLSGTGINGTGALVSRASSNRYLRDLLLDLRTSVGVDLAGATLTLEGNNSGAAGLTKVGAGTLELTGTTTTAGATIIDAGVLRLTGTATAVTINGGTLAGAGTAGAITLNADGTIAPTGTLAASSLLWNGGGVLALRIGGSAGPVSDRVQLSGNLTKGTGSGFEFFFSDSLAGPPVAGSNLVVGNYIGTNFVDADFTYSYAGEPTSVLAGEFIVGPTQLQFMTIAISLFQDGFEEP